MNPFMEPTVARPLPAGTGLSGHQSQPSGRRHGPAPDSPRVSANPGTPGRRAGRQRQRTSSRRLPLPRALLVAGVFVLASLVLPGAANAVDVNQASETELTSLKGIGPKTAQSILSERQRGGPYASLIDLSERVKGIGPKKLASLKEAGLMVGHAAAADKGAASATATTGKK
ncbi:MAG TPA: helix-hairpin-helix domain-containing protein [Burkholderiaceae bacterium]|nr:helix-hairpin-helix domain-containing protein [Burkholderiaceae bacterium]